MGSAIRWGRPWRSMFLQLQPLKRPVPWVEVSSRRPSSPQEGDDHAGLKVCGRSLRQASLGTLVGEVRRQQYGSDADVEMGSARVRQRSLNALKLDHDNMGLHSLYVNDAIRGYFEAVQLGVFWNVFNNIYNITTRYVWIIIWSYTVQKFCLWKYIIVKKYKLKTKLHKNIA